MATLQEHYNQINEGKGNKAQFLKQARELFPQHFNQYSDFNTVTKTRRISLPTQVDLAGGKLRTGDLYYDTTTYVVKIAP